MKATQNPCKPDCQNRSATCRLTCKRYKIHHAVMMKIYAENNKKYKTERDFCEMVMRIEDMKRKKTLHKDLIFHKRKDA